MSAVIIWVLGLITTILLFGAFCLLAWQVVGFTIFGAVMTVRILRAKPHYRNGPGGVLGLFWFCATNAGWAYAILREPSETTTTDL